MKSVLKNSAGPVLVCASLIMGAPAANAVPVNLSSTTNASLDGSTGVTLLLGPGTYSITPVNGPFTAFTRFNNISGCDLAGENCTSGYEYSFRASYDSTTLGFGDGNANGGIGPLNPGNAYYQTDLQAFNAASPFVNAFTLASATLVDFYIVDDFLADNSGGISLDVSANDVPEPLTLSLFGAGVAGAAALRRRKAKKG